MADKIISGLEAVGTITGDMLLAVEDAIGTFAASVDDLTDYVEEEISTATITATAAATTTLTASSNATQIFTGSTTQNVNAPVVSTLYLGKRIEILNKSSGVVTARSSGGNTIQAMDSNTKLLMVCVAITGTGTASWSWAYLPIESALPSVATAATQSDQETASSTSVYVTPARQQFHPSAAKSWGKVTYSAGVPSAVSSYNVSSLTDLAAGDGKVNTIVSFSSANFAVMGTENSFVGRAIVFAQEAVNRFRWVIETSNDDNFSFAAFGDQ